MKDHVAAAGIAAGARAGPDKRALIMGDEQPLFAGTYRIGQAGNGAEYGFRRIDDFCGDVEPGLNLPGERKIRHVFVNIEVLDRQFAYLQSQ